MLQFGMQWTFVSHRAQCPFATTRKGFYVAIRIREPLSEAINAFSEYLQQQVQTAVRGSGQKRLFCDLGHTFSRIDSQYDKA